MWGSPDRDERIGSIRVEVLGCTTQTTCFYLFGLRGYRLNSVVCVGVALLNSGIDKTLDALGGWKTIL